VHVTNSGNCTWYDFAAEILRASGMRPQSTCNDRRIPASGSTAAYSVLSPDSLHAYNIRMPEWQDALQRYLSLAPFTTV